MAKFENPVLVELDDISEGVFAAGSGGGDNPPPGSFNPPEGSYSLKFRDLNCGSYCILEFKAFGVNTHEYGQIDYKIHFKDGSLHNKLDIHSFERIGDSGSGLISNWNASYTGDNTISLSIYLKRQNQSDNLEVKFKAKWDHDYLENANGNHSYGSYNGLFGGEQDMDIKKEEYIYTSNKPIFYHR